MQTSTPPEDILEEILKTCADAVSNPVLSDEVLAEIEKRLYGLTVALHAKAEDMTNEELCRAVETLRKRANTLPCAGNQFSQLCRMLTFTAEHIDDPEA